MQKNIPIFWISLSFLYLLIEVMFRADVINLAATSGDQHQLLALEHVGRFISSLGVAIFLTSLLKTKSSHSDRQKLHRRLAMLPVFIGCYMLSSYAQEWAIEKYASETPPEFKREATLANSYRDIMYFGQANKKTDLSWLTSDEQVLLALTPILAYGDPGLEQFTTPAYDGIIKNLNLLKLEKTASISDARVFDYHRQWVKAIGWKYQSLVEDERSAGPAHTISNKTEMLYKLMLRDGWDIIRAAAKSAGNNHQSAEPTYSEYESTFKERRWTGLDLSGNLPRLARGSTSFESLFSYSNAKHFVDGFHDAIAEVYVTYLKGLNKSNRDDVGLKWFFEQRDFKSLKKYYNLNISMRDACKAHPGKSNELMLVTGASGDRFISYPLSSEFTRDLHIILTGAIQKKPVIIACSYTYESAIKQMRGLKETLSKRAAMYNPQAAHQLANTNVDTVKRSSLFKHAAVAVMFEEDRKLRQLQHKVNNENTIARPALMRFSDMTQYDRFVSALDLTSVESFDRSIRAAKDTLAKDAFLKWTSGVGLDFQGVMQPRPGFRFYNAEVFEDTKLIAVFKKAMPEIFNAQGRFIALEIPSSNMSDIAAFVKGVPGHSKTKIRELYAEMLAGKQEDALEDSSVMSQGGKMETAGKNTAKGFIAPAFVLFVSNIMIAVTLISILSTLTQAYFHERPSVLRTAFINIGAAALLIGPAMLIKNDHIHKNMAASQHSLIVQQTHFTANIQKVYDVILPSFIRPTWMYKIIKGAVSPRERVVMLF